MDNSEITHVLDETEEWFVDRGIPHLIANYSAKEDVWTRAIRFLIAIFLAELFLTFGPEVSGWRQFGVFMLGLGIATGSVAVANIIAGRKPLSRPNDIGFIELGLFIFIPAVLSEIGGNSGWLSFGWIIVANILILLVTYFIVSWAIFPMVWWGLKNMWEHISQLSVLFARMIPLMLLFSAFLFINAELWQVANEFQLSMFLTVIGGLLLLGVLFLFSSLKGVISKLRKFKSVDDVLSELEGTPLVKVDRSLLENSVLKVSLGRGASVNLKLRLAVGLVTQMVLVGLLVFIFYVIFGLLTVQAETLVQWTTLKSYESVEIYTMSYFGNQMILTELHLIVAAFVASFSALQFAVSLITDSDYRDTFVADSDAEVREALAVRAAYLSLYDRNK